MKELKDGKKRNDNIAKTVILTHNVNTHM